MRVETWGENSLRVRASLLEIDEQVWALLKQKEIKPEIDIVPEKVTVRNGEIVCNIHIDPENIFKRIPGQPWSIVFTKPNGEELLAENHHKFKRWRGVYLKQRGGD